MFFYNSTDDNIPCVKSKHLKIVMDLVVIMGITVLLKPPILKTIIVAELPCIVSVSICLLAISFHMDYFIKEKNALLGRMVYIITNLLIDSKT